MRYPSFITFLRPDYSNVTQDSTDVERMNYKEDDRTRDEKINTALSLINERLSSELLEIILSKSPQFFEQLVLELLDKMGYAFDKESIIRTSYTNDEGIDGIIQEDTFGFSCIYIQAKRWSGNVGRPEIQKFLGAVAGQGGVKGLFITTSIFTAEAIRYVNKQLQVKLVLVDGKRLTDLMIKYGLGVSVVKTYNLKQLDTDYFEEVI